MVLLFNTIGHIIVFNSMRFAIRNEVKANVKKNIPLKELILITIDASNEKEIYFLEEDEFLYKDKMYDIVRSERKGNSVTYYCLNDSKEEELFANLNSEVKKNMDSNPVRHKSQQILKKINLSLFYEEANTLNKNTFHNIFYPFNKDELLYLSFDVLTPPPEQL